MNEKNEIMVIHGKEVPETLRADMTAVVNGFEASVNNSKSIAGVCYKLRVNPAFGATFAPEADDCKKAFIAVVEEIASKAGCPITGNTAYKYAQCFEIYHNDVDIWKYFNIGKMIITSRLEANTSKTNRSTRKFIVWLAMCDDLERRDKLTEWQESNKDAMARIEALKKAGFDTTAEVKALPPKPSPAPYKPTKNKDKDTEYYFTTGLSIVIDSTDKQLKELVKKYIEENPTTEEAEKRAKQKVDEQTEEGTTESESTATHESLLNNAIASLIAYTSSLEEVPEELTKALMLLKSNKED